MKRRASHAYCTSVDGLSGYVPSARVRALAAAFSIGLVLVLGACSSTPLREPIAPAIPVSERTTARDEIPVFDDPAPAETLVRGKSRWVPVAWSDLAGLCDDALFEAWNAWLKSCQRPAPPYAALCSEVRLLSIADASAQRDWLQQRLRPYRVESLQGDATGLLTGYFEPLLDASRVPTDEFSVPLYQPPVNLAQRKPWYSRQEIDTQSAPRAALQGRAIAYVAHPIDALVLQIQGSGRLRLVQPDGGTRWVRLSFAGSNDQPYRSIGRWLLDQGLVKDASWPGIRDWLANNPQRQQELLWVNPRVVFFKEEPLSEMDAQVGPRGAQGVALTPGRSIAVDPSSIPYGAPVWLVSRGSQVSMQKLVLAQDTGSAITGPVRADYFAGWGSEAGEVAARLRQPLQMWVLWPK
jgi:membrane-bound lytic murein transglycosylase A